MALSSAGGVVGQIRSFGSLKLSYGPLSTLHVVAVAGGAAVAEQYSHVGAAEHLDGELHLGDVLRRGQCNIGQLGGGCVNLVHPCQCNGPQCGAQGTHQTECHQKLTCDWQVAE